MLNQVFFMLKYEGGISVIIETLAETTLHI